MVETVPAAGVPAEVMPEPTFQPTYAGIVTRGAAMVLDAGVVSLVALLVGVGAALIVNLLHLPSHTRDILAIIGGAVYLAWIVGYFSAFWSTTGQTPGNRVLEIRVTAPGGGRVSLRHALVRCGGIVLCALPLFLGFAPILFDSRRRSLADRLSATVVVNAPQTSWLQRRALQRQQDVES